MVFAYAREKINYFRSHPFVQDVVVLQAGSVTGIFIQAISGVVIARLLQPELFGQYSVAFSIASIVTVLLGAGVQDAIAPQTARAWAENDSSSLREALGFWAKFTFANIIATLAVVLVLPILTAHLYHNSVLGQYAVLIILASLISTTVFTITQFMLQIVGRIRMLSLVTFLDVAIRYGVVIALLLLGWGIWGAVSGHFIGALVVFVISILIYHGLAVAYPRIPSFLSLIALAKTTSWRPLLRPTLLVMVDRNLGMLYSALPIAMVGVYMHSTEVAYFKLAFGYLMIAMAALGPISTLLNVRFPTLQVTDKTRLRYAFVQTTLYSTLMTTGITIAVLVVAPWVFGVLYGIQYLPALPYVRGLFVFGALFGVGVGLGPMWRAVGKVHISIIINVVTLAIGIPVGIWLIAQWQLAGAILMVTLWYTVSHAVSFLLLEQSLRKV